MYYTLFLIIFIFILIKNKKYENWKETQNDNYFSFFNKNDFRLRNCNSIEDCKKVIVSQNYL